MSDCMTVRDLIAALHEEDVDASASLLCYPLNASTLGWGSQNFAVAASPSRGELELLPARRAESRM